MIRGDQSKTGRKLNLKIVNNSFINAAIYFSILVSIFLTPVFPASAEDNTNITADHLEYLPEISSYIAKGSAQIVFGESSLQADKMQFNTKTLDAVASGNIVYNSPESIVRAERIEINLDTKIGTIHDGYIFYKKNNYHIRAKNIDKTNKNSFFLDKATITTCDADSPAWKISGSDINAVDDVKLTSWHSTFYIKKLPLLYTPYSWVPLNRERETGFLFPSFGYSSKRGQYFKQGFFWAIKDNQDMTVYLDYYKNKGLAQGLDYRYVLNPDINGEFWLYHAEDQNPTRDLYEFKSYHNVELPYNVSSYLKLHHVNEFDYYDVMELTSNDRVGFDSMASNPFGLESEGRQLKYLESNLLITKSFNRGRTYLLGQYRQNLEGDSDEIPQTVPEIGFALNTESRKYFSYNLAVKANNFVRDVGQHGQRIDIYPNIYFSYGRSINITQRIGIRETFYILDDPDTSDNRLFFNSSTTLMSRAIKIFPSFVHTVIPSLEYTYIPEVEERDTIFDSVDSFSQENKIIYSLTNEVRGIKHSTLRAKFNLSQDYNFLVNDKPFSDLLVEGRLSNKIVQFDINTTYDVYNKIVTDSISAITLRGTKSYIGVGKNFRRSSVLDQITYKIGLKNPIQIGSSSIPVSLHGQLWQNLNSNKTERINIRSSYTHQCWGFSVNYTKLPDEYEIMFVIELAGLGSLSSQTLMEDNILYQDVK